MKKQILLFIACFTGAMAFAQNAAKELFSNNSSRIAVNERAVNNLFSTTKGQTANLFLEGIGQLEILVNMNEWNEEKVRTIGGKLKGMEDAIITITQMDQPGSLIYEGSIISARKNSAFKITTSNGQVFFEKTEKDKIIVTD
ncbi:MAG: hypothetical protein IPO46_02260 [Chitinophagaceae bacterium]|jgi:hypothetical protein|nr:hypothetical protein [Chitinophagaceae bacterium]MBP6047203.1 hypothetical protein [Ferruginibacter sp.]MBK8773494.1 hypothetical protein [Chitinophagaceae bacterium]MBK8928769.1 hypothetical protein [Chitinophagaceae bacterium]MBK9957979.1 hypothetical protein [Chitinophagaceae bacterium]